LLGRNFTDLFQESLVATLNPIQLLGFDLNLTAYRLDLLRQDKVQPEKQDE
jgi:hypothetical protein